MAESPSRPPLPPSSQPPPAEPRSPSSQIAAGAGAGAGAGPSVSTSGEVIPASTSGTSAPVNPKPDPEAESSTNPGASTEQDVDMTAGENSSNTTMPNNSSNNNHNNAAGKNNAADGSTLANAIDPLAASAPPSKKETSLREFLGKMDEYAPIIPDAVTAHYLTVAGLPPPGNGPNQTPPHLARLLALATQKFVADIAADSYQYARIRASNSSSANNPMGSLNAASGFGGPGAAGGGAGASATGAGVSGGDAAGKGGKAGTHLGIQRPGYGGGGSGGAGQGRTVLTMEDLGMAVAEYGVSVKRGEFYR